MRLWAPWARRVYGAAFDRDTERYLPEAGLETIETRFLYKDIIKLIVARPARGGRAAGARRNPRTSWEAVLGRVGSAWPGRHTGSLLDQPGQFRACRL